MIIKNNFLPLIENLFQTLLIILLEENHQVNLQCNKYDIDHKMFSIFVLEDLVVYRY